MQALARTFAIALKEVQQMLRDKLTFAMAVGVPIMQLVLFGYAINTDPKGLPTAVVSQDNSPMARSLVAALQTSGYFHVVESGIAESRGDALLQQRPERAHELDAVLLLRDLVRLDGAVGLDVEHERPQPLIPQQLLDGLNRHLRL